MNFSYYVHRGWTHYRLYGFCGIFIIVFFFALVPKSSPGHEAVTNFSISSKSTPRQAAANATLGVSQSTIQRLGGPEIEFSGTNSMYCSSLTFHFQFQSLLALSVAPTWRTRGLKAAADLTGLEFTVPPQPHNPEELINAFEKIGADAGAKTPAHGSATAWFAHLDLLKYVIASGLETAFIVEDDVDWDVRLKQQLQLISDNVRNYTNVPDTDPTPYGTDWDVLWLGHCGSAIQDGMPPSRVYADDTRCKTDLYSGWSKHFLRDGLLEDHRALQVSAMTVCTFGYGVTKQSAQKVLDATAQGADEAFDVSLSNACRTRGLRCLVVNPQVFNHYEPPKEYKYLSEVHVGDGQGGEGNETEFEFHKGTTGNIMKSARCKALFNDVCMRPPSEI